MPAFTVSQVITNYFMFNNHNGAGSTCKNSKNTIHYTGNIIYSYNTEICRYSRLHNVYTVYNHTNTGRGMISKTVSRHVNQLIRDLIMSAAVVNVVDRSYNETVYHQAFLHHELRLMIRKQKIKEIIRVNAITHIIDNNILKYHLLPFM